MPCLWPLLQARFPAQPSLLAQLCLTGLHEATTFAPALVVLSGLIPGLGIALPRELLGLAPSLFPWSHPPLPTHHPFWLLLLLCYLHPCWTLLFCPWLSVSPASAGWQKLFCFSAVAPVPGTGWAADKDLWNECMA